MASTTEYQSWLVATSIISVMGFATSMSATISTALATSVFGERVVAYSSAADEEPLYPGMMKYDDGRRLSKTLPPATGSLAWRMQRISGRFAWAALCFGEAAGLCLILQLALTDGRISQTLNKLGDTSALYRAFQVGSYVASVLAAAGFVNLGWGLRRLAVVQAYATIALAILVPISLFASIWVIYYTHSY
ncbi:hypothetical protein M408DRAFT_332867 [Serendipita vermifera MAFF 305830]|uniref:Uncharacterized protein n=1 Tax=Serendipita vermifera MAFF 305830 TaxID=933852 RepID=A0A0C3AD51_SERVB|nr:hypothetical protein M408DRAFT_332867 [Serendipita vermifera MAFF 305830]